MLADLDSAANTPAADVLAQLESSEQGLTAAEAARRLATFGPNAVRSHGARPWAVFGRQLHNPLLLLLLAAAIVSAFTGSTTDAVIICVIVTLSVGLGFFNEYRSERAVEALHSRIRHRALVVRDGAPQRVDVTSLVPGDVVHLSLGDVVPADLRLISTNNLECDEAVLTGESVAVDKQVEPDGDAARSCALMGTVVRDGAAVGVVVRTGPATKFGHIAVGLGERHSETAFQLGLRSFSMLLVRVAGVLTASIFVINIALHRPFIDALLFSLAIAIGLTPQLLPAIVTVSLSTGTRRLARQRVLVKRLVAIEDLGNTTVLFTDKTGTLTDGHITFDSALDAAGEPSSDALVLALVCNEAVIDERRAVSGNQLDMALWNGDSNANFAERALQWKRIATRPFDHQRRLASVIADPPDGSPRVLIVKGEPEGVLARCADPPPAADGTLDRLFDTGARVIALATRHVPSLTKVNDDDERQLQFRGFLVFVDRPKADARESLARLDRLGIVVKVITGDSERVAVKVCRDLGLDVSGSLTGAQIQALDDGQLAKAIDATTVFARVDPATKARIVRIQRTRGEDVAFLGDGVNDAVALHHADVGISVDTATDVARDAADVLLLDKDLGVLADGVVEGRRIFANTVKYVLMATSSNFGNMFSAAGASAFLSFLPMLPSQILLNNLLYDASQMTIPTDNVDEEMLARPSAWDVRFIRRFMTFFGPLSSVFDFATFAVLLGVLHAGATEFRTGWFVESLATQTLVIFVIRTRRSPFWRSRPSRPLLIASLVVPVIGIVLPYTAVADALGFRALPFEYFPILVAFVVAYLGLVELGKRRFYAVHRPGPALAQRRPHRERRVLRRAARFSRHHRVREQVARPRH